MAVLTVISSSRAGVNVNTADVAADVAGDVFPNSGDEMVLFKNANASPRIVTLVLQATLDGQVPPNKTVTVPATTGEMLVGPFPTSLYNDGNGRMNFTYDAVTDLTVLVFKRGA